MNMSFEFSDDTGNPMGELYIPNERKHWKSRKRQGKKKTTLLYLMKEICATKEACIEFMKESGFMPKVMFCPHCMKKMTFEANQSSCDGYVWVCKEQECSGDKKVLSVRHGTWFENSDILLAEILLLVYFWVHGFTVKQSMKELNMTNEVIYEWNSKFTSICEEANRKIMLKGIGSEKMNSLEENAGPSYRSSGVIIWLQKNKARDLFMEFLRDADSFPLQ